MRCFNLLIYSFQNFIISVQYLKGLEWLLMFTLTLIHFSDRQSIKLMSIIKYSTIHKILVRENIYNSFSSVEIKVIRFSEYFNSFKYFS